MNPFDEYINTLKSAHMEVEFFKFQKAFHTHERIIILGNGGSNSVASHISQDYMKFHGKKVSILSDPSMITLPGDTAGSTVDINPDKVLLSPKVVSNDVLAV